jgi:Leucine-rich repeat (LRR) protein
MKKFGKTTNTLSRVPRHLGSTTVVRLLLAVSVLFFAASQVCILSAQTDEAPNPSDQLVHIPDPALRGEIEKALGKTAGEDITRAEMATLTRFGAQWIGVRDLTGLEHATHLTDLFLRGNVITDVSPLAGLTALRDLDMRSNSIVDVSALVGLTRVVGIFPLTPLVFVVQFLRHVPFAHRWVERPE